MLRVPESVEQAILGDNRKFSSTINVEYLSLRFDTAVAIWAPNAVKGCIPDQVVDSGKSYISNRLFIGTPIGGRIFPGSPLVHAGAGYVQKRPIFASRVGYIGAKASGAGVVADSLGVRISPRVVNVVRITTDPTRILIDFEVVLLSSEREVIATQSVVGNTLDSLALNFADVILPVTYVEMSVTRSTPNKRTWVVAFAPSLSRTYSGNDIVKWKLEVKKAQNRDGTIGRLYIRSLDVTLFNADRAFDEFNSSSVLFGATKPGVELGVTLQLEGTPIPIGTFFAGDWVAPEDKAEVTIRATDYVGQVRDNTIDAEILDSISAADAFRLIGTRIGLPNTIVEPSLEDIVFRSFGISGKVGSVLADLCASTQSYCWVAPDNSGLIVKHVANLTDRARYPVRWLTTNEYVRETPQNTTPAPTILKVEYAIESYEHDEIILSTTVKTYDQIPLLTYPPEWTVVPTYNRPIGGGLAPSWSFDVVKPAGFVKVDFSDSFTWETLEYQVVDLGASVRVKVWNFDSNSIDQQLTVAILGQNPNPNILLSDETHVVPAKPEDYVSQLVSTDIEVRNSPNLPYEFSLELSGKIKIVSLVPGNRQIAGGFEYVIEPGSYGYTVRVWNYLPVDQDFQVFIYGRRLVESKAKKTITLRDEVGIRNRGEILAPVTLKGMTDDSMAKAISVAMAAYYRTFAGTKVVEPWADPRLEPGDNVAVESLRGYGNSFGVVDEYTLEFAGALKQLLTLLRVAGRDRDARTFGGYALGDRPLMDGDQEGFV